MAAAIETLREFLTQNQRGVSELDPAYLGQVGGEAGRPSAA